jgi:uncharacterized protein (DUF362 family)
MIPMGTVYEEFERELETLRRQCGGDSRREMLRLLLLALEREEMVSIGYRESCINERLAAMPLDDEVRELIHHAMVWIWKDEEMHAVYVRGALLKLRSRWLRWQALSRQAAGAVGGWSASALQHTRWRRAPLSRALAWSVAAAGLVLGKVPRDVRQHLRYGPFRNFCLFNIDAEQTAWLCWARLVELAATDPQVDAELADDCRRVAADEHRHAQIFTLLAEALNDEDRLVAGHSADSLAERIGGVARYFLPRQRRSAAAAENPLGSGGKVWSLRGQSAEEKVPLFHRLLDESGLEAALAQCARRSGRPIGDVRVAIKPTFMLAYDRRDRSPLTDPVLVEELARWLRERGCRDISVLEGRTIYDRFYARRSVREVAEHFGFYSDAYRLVDAQEEQTPHTYPRGLAQYTVARTWKEADVRITFGKVRSHPVELALLALGNLEWVGARCDEYLFLERQADRATPVMMLLDDFPPHFALLEGYDAAADGLVGVMGSPRPLALRRLYAGADALAVDIVAARHLGIADPRDSSLLKAACHWFGGWSPRIEVVGCDEPIEGWRGPYHNDWRALLSFLAMPVYTHGSARGALFVPEMDEAAFPPLSAPGPLLRAGRAGVQALLGLRHPRRALRSPSP